jgi:predicted metal-dependent hydrolase
MTIDEVIFCSKRKKPLGEPPRRRGVRFVFPKLFKAKEASVSHANWLNNRQKILQKQKTNARTKAIQLSEVDYF